MSDKPSGEIVLYPRDDGATAIERLPERAMRKFGISEFSTNPINFYNVDASRADVGQLKRAQRKLEGKKKKAR